MVPSVWLGFVSFGERFCGAGVCVGVLVWRPFSVVAAFFLRFIYGAPPFTWLRWPLFVRWVGEWLLSGS